MIPSFLSSAAFEGVQPGFTGMKVPDSLLNLQEHFKSQNTLRTRTFCFSDD